MYDIPMCDGDGMTDGQGRDDRVEGRLTYIHTLVSIAITFQKEKNQEFIPNNASRIDQNSITASCSCTRVKHIRAFGQRWKYHQSTPRPYPE